MASLGVTAMESGSAAGANSLTRTLSSGGSLDGDGYGAQDRTIIPQMSTTLRFGSPSADDVRVLLEKLEALQMDQRSPQQPNPELDSLIADAIEAQPELRMRLAVQTKSPWLRKKILAMLPEGGRQAGSATLGSHHPWRSVREVNASFTDSNWPKVTYSKQYGSHLPGGTLREHTQVLRAPADKLRMDPTIRHSEYYSVPRAQRFPGTKPNGELNKGEMQKKGTPGPGTYSKSLPRGTAFLLDGGETVVLGANHICPWKSALGHQINPIEVDQTSLPSAPKYTFSKTSRFVSETHVGHGRRHGGLVKSDEGCLSPGHVYEQYSSVRPNVGKALSLKRPRQSRSTPALSRVRCVPVEPSGFIAGMEATGL